MISFRGKPKKIILWDGITQAAIDSQTGNQHVTDFNLEVAKGNINGHSSIHKFGENPNVGTSPAEDIWDQGGAYTFSSSAIIDTVSSSNNGDTQDIIVEGLDINWNEVSVPVTLTGQAKVVMGTSLIRVNRAYLDDNVTISGNVYIYEDTAISTGTPVDATKIRARIRDGFNQTLMAIYSVPAGKTAYMLCHHFGISKGKTASADFTLRAALFGQKFRARDVMSVNSTGSSTYTHTHLAIAKFPEKTDIKIRCERASTNTVSVAAGFDMTLVDN